jgi:hypothetical protein
VRAFHSKLSDAALGVRDSARGVCTQTREFSRTICDATGQVEEVVCDATETISETVCDATDTVTDTVCDSWGTVPVVGGLVCAASHTVSTTVCTASHVVSTTVCTASHVVSTTVCLASHVVSAAICIAWEIAAAVLYVVLKAIVDIIGSFLGRIPEVCLIVRTARPLPLEHVQALVDRHLPRGWRVEHASGEAAPWGDSPRLAGFYFVTKKTLLAENPFDLCHRLREAAGFVRVEPDLPYTGYMGGPIL